MREGCSVFGNGVTVSVSLLMEVITQRTEGQGVQRGSSVGSAVPKEAARVNQTVVVPIRMQELF